MTYLRINEGEIQRAYRFFDNFVEPATSTWFARGETRPCRMCGIAVLAMYKSVETDLRLEDRYEMQGDALYFDRKIADDLNRWAVLRYGQDYVAGYIAGYDGEQDNGYRRTDFGKQRFREGYEDGNRDIELMRQNCPEIGSGTN